MIDFDAARPSVSRSGSDITATSATTLSSVGSSVDQSTRTLLFGEISSSSIDQSNCSQSSICNLVLSSSSSFFKFWMSENCRESFLQHVDRDTLPSMRLVCHNFAANTTPILFKDLTITFKASTFKGSRTLYLRRIGKHVKNLTFNVPHSGDSFLPPLLDQFTGEQVSFNYKPQVESPIKNKEPKYGSWEMTDLLIRQYPTIFHAATNIPAFIRAFSAMPNIEHMTIFSPDQNMSPRYRKSTADYTLISLRIAIERSPLDALTSLSLRSLHPTALLCLQPKLSYGSTPNSCRRWTQIQKLSLEVDSTPMTYRMEENLSVIQSYLRSFSTSLTHLSFRWSGREKGPSPISPDANSVIWQAKSHMPSSPKSDSQRPVSPRSMRFFKLQYLTMENAIMDSEQVASFITNHRQTLIEFSFEDVSLRNGDWQSTLEPLRKLRRKERSRPRLQPPLALHPATFASEEMEVPCKLSPVDLPGDEPLILDTLEPQDEEPAPWIARGKNFGVRRWFDRANNPPPRRHQRKVSDHLKRVFNGNIFSWR
ncbi:hypothetical protein BT63DRAFT_425482 [Microthyrium microscopicum]|uniref:Uncharacterized protein n=1 Tax=Microthyrium microscopicum TaxID=703497 RepID=A0A6A6UB66_9PEZI|nr:hypothetical protein BT63DRAFT_425482 [Microthyrium microscopicum]